MMKFIYPVFFCCLFLVSVGCSDESDEELNDLVAETSIAGTYEGLTFSAAVANGLVDGDLSGNLILSDDETYSSTLSPFSLSDASGSWSYKPLSDQLIFNEGDSAQEIAENLTLRGDSLFFTIYRGEPASQTVFNFSLLRQ